MSRQRTALLLTALASGFVLSTAANVQAEQAPVADTPPMSPAQRMWTDPPAAVQAAAAALRSACGDWQQERPLPANPSPAEALHRRPAEVTVCEAAINPEEVRLAQETSYIVLAAAVVGLALASFVAAGFVLRFIAMWVRWGAEAAWDTWPSFRRRYQ